MRAARAFAEALVQEGSLERVARVRVELFGSLAATGRGHHADRAVLLGLTGEQPEECDPGTFEGKLAVIRRREALALVGRHEVQFCDDDLVLDPDTSLPLHPNGMRFTAYDTSGAVLLERTAYSVGGGFVVNEPEGEVALAPSRVPVPHPFGSAEELLAHCDSAGRSIAQVVLENELAQRSGEEVRSGLQRIWSVMQECVGRGLSTDGTLPGGLGVKRRAPGLARSLMAKDDGGDPMRGADWLTLYALAVNEENAAGGRVVTAPTNGAAGVIPAVLHYYRRFVGGADDEGVCEFLLTAAAIGLVVKQNASISGAEVGCQGEVGTACAMAAGALAAVLGGTPRQVENAAEIGMEHNLGLTCDPIGGLVQVPCIERNAVAAVKAVTAARTALHGDGSHLVSLDAVIATMRQTGADMSTKYKETSRGGLAVTVQALNLIEC
jgi:L-serine dehydratase